MQQPTAGRGCAGAWARLPAASGGARAKRAGGDVPGSGADRGGVGAGAPTREATRPGKGADASMELERGRKMEELKRGGGRGGAAGRVEPERGASASRYGAVPAARARCSVWRRRRAR